MTPYKPLGYRIKTSSPAKPPDPDAIFAIQAEEEEDSFARAGTHRR
jgi:hypothetical protein